MGREVNSYIFLKIFILSNVKEFKKPVQNLVNLGRNYFRILEFIYIRNPSFPNYNNKENLSLIPF